MKIYFLSIFLSIFLFSCNRVNTVSDEKSNETTSTKTENIKTIKLDVSGMTCEGCENTIESALNKVDGVVSVEASHINAIATISFDSTKLEQVTIAQKINETGYKVLQTTADGNKHIIK